MSEIYRAILATRSDMTEWLIHSTRRIGDVHRATMLAKILCEGVLRPGFAFRGNPERATIYGPHSAVCFSEQPLDAFANCVRARGAIGSMAPYGILVHKHDVYVAGGLPVIYGHGGCVELGYGQDGFDATRRLLRPTDLPFDEQHRYVAFAPTRKPHPMDWSHEREWRWPANAFHARDQGLYYLTGEYWDGSRGHFEGRLVAFVALDREVEWLQRAVADSIASFAGVIPGGRWGDYSEEWTPKIGRVAIVSLETVEREVAGNSAFARLETIDLDSLPSLRAPKGRPARPRHQPDVVRATARPRRPQ